MSARVRFSGTMFACVWVLTFCGVARGDDTAIEGVGGVLKPMHGHPSVRMVSEEVHIKLPQDEPVQALLCYN